MYLSLPVSPFGADAVALTTRGGDAAPVVMNAGRLHNVRAPIVLSGESVVAGFGALPDALVVTPSDLPRLASAYAHIRALVIDGTTLAQLDEDQLRALVEHIGNCGRMLLVGAAPTVQRALEQRAGCGGLLLQTTANRSALDPELATLLGRRVSALPSASTLSTLLSSRSTDLQLMTLYLAGFVAVFVLLTIIPRTRLPALGFCALVTGLAATLWTAEPSEAFIAWSEVHDGDRIARYMAIDRATARARGERTLQTQSLARSPREISGRSLTLHWSMAPAERHLDWSASLLEEAQVVSAGSFNVEPNLRAGTDGEVVTVCNSGAATSPPAYLRWHGTTYAVPALAPSAKWSAVDATPVSTLSPELRLLARRTQNNALTLLQPLRVPANGGVRQAWLMRLESDAPQASPCLG